MKKNLKKVLSLVLAFAMVFAMSVTVFADGDECTITIDGTSGATYSLYKLLDVTVSETTTGTGTEAVTTTNYAYSVNSKYNSVLATASGSASDVVAYIGALSDSEVRTFADSLYTEILADTSITADYTTSSTTVKVAYGYYLIVETATSSTDSTDTYSLVILDTAASSTATISTKESIPTITKQLVDIDDSTDSATIDTMIKDPTSDSITWQDTADYDIDDTVLFKLEGTLSDQYANYKEYYYAFHDAMCDGLEFDTDSVQVYVLNGSDYTKLSTSDYTVITSGLTDGCDFEVVIADLKKITTATISSSSKIVVYYTAKLTGASVVYGNPGNENAAYLEYSSNPYFTSDGITPTPTGETPKDGVIVFTYYIEITKTDKSGNALNGATFTLKKYNASSTSTDKWEVVDTISGTSSNVFTFKGLDDGYYMISEDVVPDGYNGIDPIYFTVTAGHTTPINSWGTGTTYLTSLNATTLDSTTATSLGVTTGELTLGANGTSVTTGEIAVTVKNTAGSLLPATGGIGTTIFYIVGALLVIGAGVLLVTRRRAAR